MKHNKTNELHHYWLRLRGTRAVPERSEVEPADIRGLLPHAFVIECDTWEGFTARIAGTAACALFMRDLKGTDFLSIWDESDRDTLAKALAVLGSDKLGVYATWRGRSSRYHEIEGELLVLPLARAGKVDRAIALFLPLEEPYWMGSFPLEALSIESIRLIDARNEQHRPFQTGRPSTPHPLLGDNLPVQTVGHLSVFDGGRR